MKSRKTEREREIGCERLKTTLQGSSETKTSVQLSYRAGEFSGLLAQHSVAKMANHGNVVRSPTMNSDESRSAWSFADVGEDPRQGKVDHNQEGLEENGQKEKKNQNLYGVHTL